MDTQTPKRPASPSFIPNPFIKKRNLEWTIEAPSIGADDDAPECFPDEVPCPQVKKHDSSHAAKPLPSPPSPPTTSAIEAGDAIISDHLTRFTADLSKHSMPDISPGVPRLPVSSYASLYTANEGSADGAHFVIHQHDHPVAGTHYDLRLQINESSSVSWAIMYGLPGDPNSVRLNRNATETRIHCLWNHLIETASQHTGSLLIWDTGTYSILPRRSKYAPKPDPSSQHDSLTSSSSSPPTQQSLLHAAFQNRKIRIRLHGSKLPDPYVLNLRLTKSEDADGRARSGRTPRRRRRRTGGDGRGGPAKLPPPPPPETDSSSRVEDSEDDDNDDNDRDEGGADVTAPTGDKVVEGEKVSAEERELREIEDAHVRATNAYTGSLNTIGSVHQRRWYLSLDRRACGFTERRRGRLRGRQGRAYWERDSREATGTATATGQQQRDAERRGDLGAGIRDEGEDWGGVEGSRQATRLSWPFYVRGVDHERSVVTGRTGEDILRDNDVTGFVRRQGWKPVMN